MKYSLFDPYCTQTREPFNSLLQIPFKFLFLLFFKILHGPTVNCQVWTPQPWPVGHWRRVSLWIGSVQSRAAYWIDSVRSKASYLMDRVGLNWLAQRKRILDFPYQNKRHYSCRKENKFVDEIKYVVPKPL